jgi:putative PIN family toxin of toxin-antitoxin system
MIRCIIDTNTIISGLINFKSKPQMAIDFALLEYEVLSSDETIIELFDVINRSKFDKYISFEERYLFSRKYINLTLNIKISQSFTICRDPKDNKFLDLAYSGNADYIITGDKYLLELNPFYKTKIVTPSEFLDLIG